ncbi:hypothetical protein M2D63_020110 [Pseudomonas sp. BJa5]|uniref:hypothetical protein n=1 Tax=Pseudomonas sp. BJa5 TaxID=2936270 RepID=UPI002559F8D2|nr:hypothetical protein [Pseudomonas sp. BGr12]MDL2423420.1 hypothetical protein [Pseudomonas sp. BGr12]
MSDTEKPAGEGRTSRQGAVTQVLHQSVQCYFRPDTEELVFVADDQAGAFEQHWQGMLVDMDDYHQANAGYTSALQRYTQAYAQPGGSALAIEAQLMAVITAEDQLEKQRTALQEKLGTFSMAGMSYDDVVELLPIGDTRNTGKAQGKKGKGKQPVGRRYVYVKKGYYDNSQKSKGLRNVSLKSRDKQGAMESIYSRDKQGRVRIDGDKLKKQLTTLKTPALKLELKDLARWTGMEEQLDSLNSEGTVDWKPFGYELFGWAETWNESLQTEHAVNDNVDVSAAAQFMRYASNVGASAEYDPRTGQAALKGEGKASFTVASGTAERETFVPDKLGWSLAYTTSKGQAFDLGMLRLCVSSSLTGFIGASVMVEGQLQVVVQGDQQMMAGQPGGRLPRFTERRTTGARFHQQMNSEDEGLTLSAEAFAGARVEGQLKGALQWLKPAAPPDLDGSLAGVLKSSGQFTDFCSISPNIAGMTGIGGGGKFHCTFINGKFCFHVAASLCWGVGAKGGLVLEVGVNKIAEFGAWLIYQLYRLDYGFLDLIKSDAFMAYSQYCVLQAISAEVDYYKFFNKMKEGSDSVARDFKKVVTVIIDENKKELEGSSRRNQLAENVNGCPERLLGYTPEAKGILLYLLTRHGVWDLFDPGNRSPGLIPDIYGRRKEAVIHVLSSIQTRSEWQKVLCRMTPDGISMSDDNDLVVVEQQEQYLIGFLQLGFNRDQGLYKAKAELVAIRERLKSEISWGHALAMNFTRYYQLNTGPNPHYPQCCDFGSDEVLA